MKKLDASILRKLKVLRAYEVATSKMAYPSGNSSRTQDTSSQRVVKRGPGRKSGSPPSNHEAFATMGDVPLYRNPDEARRERRKQMSEKIPTPSEVAKIRARVVVCRLCESCNDTGWYGDNGPGIKHNREYHECDQCTEAERNRRKDYRTLFHLVQADLDAFLSLIDELAGEAAGLTADIPEGEEGQSYNALLLRLAAFAPERGTEAK